LFTEKGEVNFSIEFENEIISFIIEDTGIGIDEIYLEDIFEKFMKVEDRNKPYHVGAGLGLPLSKELANSLGGEIKVSSVKGKGSVFTFYLPMNTL
jgi:signal transduction histidine kinase